MLNFGQRCLLCNSAIDTPKHLFDNCTAGSLLRSKRDTIIRIFNTNNRILNEEEKIYSVFNHAESQNKIIQYLITVSNYSIFRTKMKKYFNREHTVHNSDSMFFF